MHLPSLVAKATRPVAATCLILLAAGMALTAATPPPAHDRFSVLFWAAGGTAAALLAAMLLIPTQHASRLRTGAFGGAGILAAVVQGNGLTQGASRGLTLGTVLLCLAIAIPALLVRMESDQQRPVRRL